jgi:hypothetical protein
MEKVAGAVFDAALIVSKHFVSWYEYILQIWKYTCDICSVLMKFYRN